VFWFHLRRRGEGIEEDSMTTIIDQPAGIVADHEDMLARALAALEANEPGRIAASGDIQDALDYLPPWTVIYVVGTVS
jgi:hypothetical protein